MNDREKRHAAVDEFAKAMKERLDWAADEKEHTGWDGAYAKEFLAQEMADDASTLALGVSEDIIDDQDPLLSLDIANRAMFLWWRWHKGLLSLVASALVFTGCQAAPVDPAPVPGPVVTNSVMRRAVVAGLTSVDPAAYQGWAGACPGCDVDAQVFAMLCEQQGILTTELHNAQATKAGLLGACRAAWKGLQTGDLLVLYVSGHGGQIRDTSGDEADGQDETLCLWDGELSDDVLGELWQEMPAGVRVLFVTDTCNSGSNFKYRPRRLFRSIPRAYSGQLIHFGGCADGKTSSGSESGGVFTTALIDGWSSTNSYAQWFNAAASNMPKSQVLQYLEYGSVLDSFRSAQALR